MASAWSVACPSPVRPRATGHSLSVHAMSAVAVCPPPPPRQQVKSPVGNMKPMSCPLTTPWWQVVPRWAGPALSTTHSVQRQKRQPLTETGGGVTSHTPGPCLGLVWGGPFVRSPKGSRHKPTTMVVVRKRSCLKPLANKTVREARHWRTNCQPFFLPCAR